MPIASTLARRPKQAGYNDPRSRHELRELCRRFDTSRIKQADIGGDQESGFEQAFAALGYNFLKDKAPRLLDFIVGFQLVDRNEDNTKAVGVFGCKVGKQWLYCPIFFLNGDLKGHELLYVKNQDIFVPLKENWVNYLMSRKPQLLGEASKQDVFQLGGMHPNLQQLSHPPSRGKFGADLGGGAIGPAAPVAPPITPPTMQPARDNMLRGMVDRPPAASIMPTVTPPNLPGAPQPARDKMMSGMRDRPPGFIPASLGLSGLAAGANHTPTAQPLGPPAPAPTTQPVKAGIDFGIPVDEWAEDVLPMFAACATKSARLLWKDRKPQEKLDLVKLASAPFKAAFLNAPTLDTFLRRDWRLAKAAWDITRRYPGIKQGFDKFYGADFFEKLAVQHKTAADSKPAFDLLAASPTEKRASNRPPGILIMPDVPVEKKAVSSEKVKILTKKDVGITRNTTITDQGLDDKEKEKILSHGYLVKDERTGEEVTKAYNVQVKQTLTTPDKTGLYDVLEAPGEFSRMLVITRPEANDGGGDFITLIRIQDGDKEWLNAHSSGIFARKMELDEEYRDWWNKLPEKDDLEKGGTYVAVGETGSGTVPFEVREKYTKGDYKAYRVNFHNETDWSRGRANWTPLTQYTPGAPVDISGKAGYISSWNARLILNQRNDAKLRAVGGDLHVPDTFRFFKLKDPPKPKKDKDSILESDCCGSCGSDPKPIMPGDLKDIQMLFTEKTSSLRLHGDAHEVNIFSKSGHDRMSWGEGLFHLIRVHGVTEPVAHEMLKAAQVKATHHSGVTYRLKYADEYPMIGPGAPAIPPPEYGTEQMGYNSVRSIYPQQEGLQVPGLEASRTDPRVYDPFLNITPDQGAMQFAQQAAQSGQKEVFDTSMISSMLKSVRDDSLIDKHLADLMKALSACGSLLMSLFWHGEQWKDRFGAADMPDVEDSIRNVFSGLGDLVLSLKESSPGARVDDEMDFSLEDTARN